VTPGLAWLRRWGISIASFIGGLLTLFVFRRELEHVGWVIGYLLLLWLLVVVLALVRQALEASEKRAHRWVITAADYTIQTLYHGVLLFLIPPYWASTTLGSRNAVFLVLLVALAVLATFDPWYHVVAHGRPWMGYAFFLVSVFGALNVALPLVGVQPEVALVLAAAAAAIGLTPAACRARRWPWQSTLAVTALAAVVAGVTAWAVRAWVPPAPLSLARAAIAWGVADLEPSEPISGAVRADEVRSRGIVAYTAVYAPAGLRQAVRHVWRRDGDVVTVVDVAIVRGGRRQGFRTFSRMTVFPPDVVGRWSVDVTTGSGQLIGRLRFRVVA
jgi:hypothetical protein